jgi:hypothetical protein
LFIENVFISQKQNLIIGGVSILFETGGVIFFSLAVGSDVREGRFKVKTIYSTLTTKRIYLLITNT